MDNLRDNTKSNADSSEDKNKQLQEPMIQASDDSGIPREQVQPAEIVQSAKKRVSAAESTLMPNQFMPIPGGTQAVPSAGDIIQSILHFK